MALTNILDDATAAGLDVRWAAWQQRGAAQDRVTRRRLRILFPLLVVAVTAGYILLLR